MNSTSIKTLTERDARSHKIKDKWSFTSGQSGIVIPGVNGSFKCTWKAHTYESDMRYYSLTHLNQKHNMTAARNKIKIIILWIINPKIWIQNYENYLFLLLIYTWYLIFVFCFYKANFTLALYKLFTPLTLLKIGCKIKMMCKIINFHSLQTCFPLNLWITDIWYYLYCKSVFPPCFTSARPFQCHNSCFI